MAAERRTRRRREYHHRDGRRRYQGSTENHWPPSAVIACPFCTSITSATPTCHVCTGTKRISATEAPTSVWSVAGCECSACQLVRTMENEQQTARLQGRMWQTRTRSK